MNTYIIIFLCVIYAAIAFQLLLTAKTSTTSETPHPAPSGDRFSLLSPPVETEDTVNYKKWSGWQCG